MMSEREKEIINLLRTNAEFKAYMEQLVKEYTEKLNRGHVTTNAEIAAGITEGIRAANSGIVATLKEQSDKKCSG